MKMIFQMLAPPILGWTSATRNWISLFTIFCCWVCFWRRLNTWLERSTKQDAIGVFQGTSLQSASFSFFMVSSFPSRSSCRSLIRDTSESTSFTWTRYPLTKYNKYHKQVKLAWIACLKTWQKTDNITLQEPLTQLNNEHLICFSLVLMIWDNAIECKELRLRALAESPVLQNLYTSCIPCYFHFLWYQLKKVKVAGIVETPHAYHAAASAAVLHLFALDARQVDPSWSLRRCRNLALDLVQQMLLLGEKWSKDDGH